jgi:hypothetical protein
MHLKPTSGCQISTLIFENNCGGGSPFISHKILPSLIYFSLDINRNPLHKKHQISMLIVDTLLGT